MPDATILFVEDNEDLRKNAALVLELEGYDVRLASDGLEALTMLSEGLQPHLIVSDIMMPRMDGYQLFQAVQQEPQLRGVPFIFLTARGSRQDITTGKQLGVDDYLVKPFDPEDFLIAIENKLRRTEAMRADAVQQLDEARQVLVQLLSHELRTPLTYVTGGFALLAEELDEAKSGTNQRDIDVSLSLIQSGTQRLNRLAEQMVLYSQIISGYVRAQVVDLGEPVELDSLLYDALTTYRKLAKEREIIFRQSSSSDSPLLVVGLRDLLVNAISEILLNAIQYSPRGVEVALDIFEDAEFAALRITDWGPGIPPEDQAGIWDVLIQSKRDENEQQGAGMGLPIARGIITAHQGTVELVSELGVGTSITIRLPRILSPDDTLPLS
ncbi:MAG TPA: response regulator [Aggregatilinea sp.]|uniref:hybrid sensor histidine kinase/response regulator n=1 Tax=Aggregatilinea sp. TaxID=2806333 RepID=UPI002BD43D34|nr:response regulator [Aggregatilinea sp.]HML24086.1 response regulator [Aggregatilinea sp.]